MAQRRQHEKQTMQLLELPDDLLLRILGQLPFTQRLRVAEVCRRLRALTAAPSELWREVDADVRLRGLLEEDGDGGAEVALDRGQQAQLACFRRRAHSALRRAAASEWKPACLPCSLAR